MTLDVVVLAGGDAGKVDPELSGPKGLIEICGRPMIDYVMEALRGCPDLDTIVIAVSDPRDADKFSGRADKIVSGTRHVVDSIAKAIDAVGEEGEMLVVSSDTPMLSPEAIKDFLKQCRGVQADVCYSVIPKEATEELFPGSKRTYLNLRDGTFTGGNVHLTTKQAFLRNQEVGNRLFNLRKSPLSMLTLLGIGFIVKYLTGRLDVPTLEAKAGQLLTARFKAIITKYPEMGVDVDKQEDLALVEAYLSRT